MNYHSFFFHLLLQDTCIFEVCFVVSVAFFSEVNILLFLISKSDSARSIRSARSLFTNRFASIIFKIKKIITEKII